MFKPGEIKKDFPILSRKVNDKDLVYLDSAATSQKPRQVIEAIEDYYYNHNSNVHRGAHTLGDEATELLEKARVKVGEFIGSNDPRQVVFVRNTTEALNLVAYSYAFDNLENDDRIVVTDMEHHSNIVPWQRIAEMKDAVVEYVRVTDDGWVDLADFRSKVKGAKIVAFSHVSNALGTINKVDELVRAAKSGGAVVVVDGAQAIPHMNVDVSTMGADFYAFSGHKMLGPMGIGVLYGRAELLDNIPPFLGGGGMINEVKREGSSWAKLPEKFEAGTPDVAGAVGLMSAISYLEELGMDNVRVHDREIVEYALSELEKLNFIKILGSRNSNDRSGSVSFVYNGVHAHDVATILDNEGVAVRSGHHCTMILHNRMDIPASVRASFNVYSTKEDVDSLIKALSRVSEVMGK